MPNLTPILTDAPTLRARIHRQALSAIAEAFPLDLKGRTLEAKDVRILEQDHSPNRQRDAIMKGESLWEPVKATLVLRGADGKIVDEAKNFTLVHLPYLTERHTLIMDGNEYQVANMLRRRPGVYTQRAGNGDLHATFNLRKGQNFEVAFNPEKGSLYLTYGSTNIPLYPILRGMGVPHVDIANHLGGGVADLNRGQFERKTDAAVGKLYEKLIHPAVQNASAPTETKLRAITDKYATTQIDPDVTEHTLGHRHDKVNPLLLMQAARRVLDVHNGKAEVDDVDSLAFKTFHSIDDFLSERIRLTARDWKTKAGFALRSKQNIREALRPAPFSPSIRRWFAESALLAVPTGINPIELIDHATKVTLLGEGGIPSERAIPHDARMTHPTHYGTLDYARTPESNHAGVDLRATISAHRDDIGNLYTPVISVKTGKETYMKAGDLMRHTVAFPHQELKGQVDAFVGGEVSRVDASKIDYQIPHLAHTLSPSTTLIPLLHNIQGNRTIMGSKMQTQAVPLVAREAPLLQVASHLPGKAFEQIYGMMVVPTAPIDGVVTKIHDGLIHIESKAKHAAAPERVPYQTYFPFPSKTFLHHDLTVKVGDKVTAGQPLARSNYTDPHGTLALGANLRVAYMPYHGLNSNDAVVISESAANKLTSEHAYQEVFPLGVGVELSRDKHRAMFGARYQPQQLKHLDADGVVKKGARVDVGDVLVAGISKNEIKGQDALLGRISKQLVRPFQEHVTTWGRGTPGEVIDVVKTPNRVSILVKTHESMQIGDKLCYDEETDVLTRTGWKSIAAVTVTDEVATLQDGHELRYESPTAVHSYPTGGRMYRIKSQQVDLLVTDKHQLWIAPRDSAQYGLFPATAVFGKHVRYQKNANWSGVSPEHVILPPLRVVAGQGGAGFREMPEVKIPTRIFAALLGAYISEGNLVNQPKSGDYGIEITQVKEPNRSQLLTWLKQSPFHWCETGDKYRIYSTQLMMGFMLLGKQPVRYIPNEVFSWAVADLQELFHWLMWGDGTNKNDHPVAYFSTSKQLMDDVQRLCLHIGYAANVKQLRGERYETIRGRTCWCRPNYRAAIVTSKVRPQVNHGHVHEQHAQTEEWIDNYDRPVYCVTVPRGVIYVRRNGKPVWCGNSGRYGNKGVVSKIVPDHEMVRDEHGNVIDLVMTSAGVISRINPAQIIETAVSKVADKTGKPIIYDNAQRHDAVQWAKSLLDKHGLKDKEILHDPLHNRSITGADSKGVLVGKQYIFKLFKSTDTNFSGHATGVYDINEQPLKTGGDESAKSIGRMEFDALLAHNARGILREAATVRGQKNDEYWKALQLGLPLPTPKPSFAWNKFVAMLEGAGVKVDKRNSKVRLLPMTDKDILARSTGAIQNNKTVIAKNLYPEEGGLFDPRLTGGNQGTLYAHIPLHEPVPNPVFEDPVRHLLGFTEKQLHDAVSEKGGRWVRDQLAEINPAQRLKELRTSLPKVSGQKLNNTVKQIKYLENLQREKLKPEDAYVISHVPVVPPVFRPITTMPHDPSQLMVADANRLYAHLMDVNNALKNNVLPSDLPKQRTGLYNAVSAVFGTRESADEELRGQRVKGFIASIAGRGSPKGGFFQRKIMFRTQDVSGRGTAAPDGNLGMDQVGLPEEMLWKMLDRLLVARLVRGGYPALQARQLVDQRAVAAKDALMAEIKERPVLINRAPTLHRWNIVAAYPVPVQGKTIRVNPFIERGAALDFDGDALQIHVPVTPEGVADAKRMTIPNLLLSDQTRNRLIAFPQHESILGITHASATAPDTKRPTKKFATRDEVIAAYRTGKLRLDDPIQVE